MPSQLDHIDADVLRALLERATVSTWIIDETETILFANAAATALTGYSPGELQGKPISILMEPALATAHAGYLRNFLDCGGPSTILGRVREFDILHRDGHSVPVELKAFALPEKMNGKQLFSAFISDNSMHKNTEAEMMRLARLDYLTHCLNRLGFMERAHQEVSRARRNQQALSLIVMDIDRFKRINDDHGHQAGDRVLIELVPALAKGLRSHDVFGRVGGEEFFILLPDTGLPTAATIAERLRQILACHKFEYKGTRIKATASFGCAELGADDNLDSLIQRVDRQMYAAKKAGRNRVVAEAGCSEVS